MSFFDDEPRRGADRGGGVGLGRLNFSPEPLLGIVPFVVLRATASANLTLTTSFQNVVGATVTLRHPGVWVVMAAMDFDGNGDGVGVGELLVAGAAETGALISQLVAGNRETVAQFWRVSKTALGPTVLQLQARKTSGAGTSQVNQTHTTVTAFTVPGSETLPT